MRQLQDELKTLAGVIRRPLKLMEVCGTHTVEIFRHGIRSIRPGTISLLSGPGCPVCVTSIHDVDAAISIAKRQGTTLVTFGDMMRVPGGRQSLMEARSEGADVRVMYSPMDALKLAQQKPQKEVVFFATGFETTSPLIAGTVYAASRQGVKNSGDLPTDFGFPIDVHAHEPETIYVVPIKSDSEHFPPDGKLRVYRSRTGGNQWEALVNGLPQSNCYVNILRSAMAVDTLDPCGVYFGTTGGQVYASGDSGDSWAPIVRDFPAVLSVEVQTLP